MRVTKVINLFSLAAGLVLCGITARPVTAQTKLYDINASTGSSFGGFGGNWGFNFTTTSTISVGSLGLFDVGSDGLAVSHLVGIFNSGGGAPLVFTTVDNSSTVVASTSQIGRWLFTDLGTPFSLPAGTYTLGFFNGGATDPFVGGSVATFMPGSSWIVAKARANAGSFAWPDANSPAPQGWFGPNLMTAAPGPPPGVVPEGDSLMLVGTGLIPLAGLLAWKRRSRRTA